MFYTPYRTGPVCQGFSAGILGGAMDKKSRLWSHKHNEKVTICDFGGQHAKEHFWGGGLWAKKFEIPFFMATLVLNGCGDAKVIYGQERENTLIWIVFKL